jgi:uncharacterized membrane protein HdeD (DUF308 family)
MVLAMISPSETLMILFIALGLAATAGGVGVVIYRLHRRAARRDALGRADLDGR